MKPRKVEQDKGYAWVILVITLVTNIIEASVVMSPGIYILAWDKSFNATRAELGTTGSLLSGVTYLTGITLFKGCIAKTC